MTPKEPSQALMAKDEMTAAEEAIVQAWVQYQLSYLKQRSNQRGKDVLGGPKLAGIRYYSTQGGLGHYTQCTP